MGLIKPQKVNSNELLGALKTVDGTGSGLDADLLDGKHYSNITADIAANLVIAKAYTDDQLGNIATILDTINGGTVL